MGGRNTIMMTSVWCHRGMFTVLIILMYVTTIGSQQPNEDRRVKTKEMQLIQKLKSMSTTEEQKTAVREFFDGQTIDQQKLDDFLQKLKRASIQDLIKALANMLNDQANTKPVKEDSAAGLDALIKAIKVLTPEKAMVKIKDFAGEKPINQTTLKNFVSNISGKTDYQLRKGIMRLLRDVSDLENDMREKLEALVKAIRGSTPEEAMKKILDFAGDKDVNKTKLKEFVEHIADKTEEQLREGIMKLFHKKSGPGNDMREKLEALVKAVKESTSEEAMKKILDFAGDKDVNRTKLKEFVEHIADKTDDQLREGIMKLFHKKSGPGNDMREKLEALVKAVKESTPEEAMKKILDFAGDKDVNKTKLKEFVEHIADKTEEQLREGIMKLLHKKSGPGNDMREKLEALVKAVKESTSEEAMKKILDFAGDKDVNRTKLKEFVEHIADKTDDQLREGIMKLFHKKSGPGNDMREKLEALVKAVKESTPEEAMKKILDFAGDKDVSKTKLKEFVEHIADKTEEQLREGIMKLLHKKSGPGNDMREKLETLVKAIKKSTPEEAMKKILDFAGDKDVNKTMLKDFVGNIVGKTEDQLIESIKNLFQTSRDGKKCQFEDSIKKFSEEAVTIALNKNLLKSIVRNLKEAKNEELKTKTILLGVLKEIINKTKNNEIIIAKLSKTATSKSDAKIKLFTKMEDILENYKNSFNGDWTEESVKKKLHTYLIKVFEMLCTSEDACKATTLAHEVKERLSYGKLEKLLETLSKENNKINFKKGLIEVIKEATEKVNISQKVISLFPTAKLDLPEFKANFMEYLNQDMLIQLSDDSRFDNLDKDRLKGVIARVLDGVFRRLCQHLLSPQSPGKTYCPKRDAVLNKTVEIINLYKDRHPLILDEARLAMSILRYIMMFKEKAEMFIKRKYPDCYTILPYKSNNGKTSNVKGKQSRRKRSEQTNGNERDVRSRGTVDARNESRERSATSEPDFEMILKRVFPGLVDADCKFKIKIKHVPENHFKCEGKDAFLQNNDYIDKECVLRVNKDKIEDKKCSYFKIILMIELCAKINFDLGVVWFKQKLNAYDENQDMQEITVPRRELRNYKDYQPHEIELPQIPAPDASVCYKEESDASMSQVLEGLSCKNVVYHVHCTGIPGAEGYFEVASDQTRLEEIKRNMLQKVKESKKLKYEEMKKKMNEKSEVIGKDYDFDELKRIAEEKMKELKEMQKVSTRTNPNSKNMNMFQPRQSERYLKCSRWYNSPKTFYGSEALRFYPGKKPTVLHIETACQDVTAQNQNLYSSKRNTIILRQEEKIKDPVYKYENWKEMMYADYLHDIEEESVCKFCMSFNDLRDIIVYYKNTPNDNLKEFTEGEHCLTPDMYFMLNVTTVLNQMAGTVYHKDGENCSSSDGEFVPNIRFIVERCDGKSTRLNMCGKCEKNNTCCALSKNARKDECGVCYDKDHPSNCYKKNGTWTICETGLCKDEYGNDYCTDCNGEACGTAKIQCGECVGGSTGKEVISETATVQCASTLTGLMDVVAVTLDQKADVSFSLVERVTGPLRRKRETSGKSFPMTEITRDLQTSKCRLPKSKRVGKKKMKLRYFKHDNVPAGEYNIMKKENNEEEILRFPIKVEERTMNKIYVTPSHVQPGMNNLKLKWRGRQVDKYYRFEAVGKKSSGKSKAGWFPARISVPNNINKVSGTIKDCMNQVIGKVELNVASFKPSFKIVAVKQIYRTEQKGWDITLIANQTLKKVKSDRILRRKGRSAVKFFVNVDEQQTKVIKNSASTPYLCLPYDRIDAGDKTISKNCIEVKLRNNGCPNKEIIDISNKCGLYTIKRRKDATNDQNLFLKFVWLDKDGNENHMDSNPNRLSFTAIDFPNIAKVQMKTKTLAGDDCVYTVPIQSDKHTLAIFSEEREDGDVVFQTKPCSKNDSYKYSFEIRCEDYGKQESSVVEDVEFGKVFVAEQGEFDRNCSVTAIAKVGGKIVGKSERLNKFISRLELGVKMAEDVCLPCSNKKEFVTWIKFKASKLKYRIKDACTNTSTARCLPFKVGKKGKDMAKIMVDMKDELCSESFQLMVEIQMFKGKRKLKQSISKMISLSIGDCGPVIRGIPGKRKPNKRMFHILNATTIKTHLKGTYENIQDDDIMTNQTDLKSKRFVNAVRYIVSLPHDKMKVDVIYELEVVASNDNGETAESFNLTKVSSPTCEKPESKFESGANVSNSTDEEFSLTWDCSVEDMKRKATWKDITFRSKTAFMNARKRSFRLFRGAEIKLKARKKINNQVFIVNNTLQISSDIEPFKKEDQLEIIYESLENSDPETALINLISPVTDNDTQSCPRSPDDQLILQDVCNSFNIREFMRDGNKIGDKASIINGLNIKPCEDEIISDCVIGMTMDHFNKNLSETDEKVNVGEETRKRRKRRSIDANEEQEEADDAIAPYVEVETFFKSFSSILYPVRSNTESMSIFNSRLVDYQKSLCAAFIENIDEKSIVADNIITSCDLVNFEGASMNIKLPMNGEIVFNEDLKKDYSNWICTDDDKAICEGFMLASTVLKKDNNNGMFTEPYSNGEGYEMELMSDVFIPKLFASVEPHNEIELGEEKPFKLLIPIQKAEMSENIDVQDDQGRIECHRYENGAWIIRDIYTTYDEVSGIVMCGINRKISTGRPPQPVAVFKTFSESVGEETTTAQPATTSEEDTPGKSEEISTTYTTKAPGNKDGKATTKNVIETTTADSKEKSVNVKISYVGEFAEAVSKFSTKAEAIAAFCSQTREFLEMKSENFKNCTSYAGSIVVDFHVAGEEKTVENTVSEISQQVENGNLRLKAANESYRVDPKSMTVDGHSYKKKPEKESKMKDFYFIIMGVCSVALLAGIIIAVFLCCKKKDKNVKVIPSPRQDEIGYNNYSMQATAPPKQPPSSHMRLPSSPSEKHQYPTPNDYAPAPMHKSSKHKNENLNNAEYVKLEASNEHTYEEINAISNPAYETLDNPDYVM